ncbi:hypothetical protein [Streptomyces sp. SID3343]|uniref:hypothetical protein n=1 Tax=Streptomyces sp. SID3343 TaxID=2690260 RepID=UPI00136DE647|nr:hypothetical protein [Streptomyces sp. SID3343]MYV96803.1 hypothetical protein [Streptomyces sp. SID3343]
MVEFRRLARNPILWALAVAAVALQYNDVRDRAPDLSVETVSLAGYGLFLAAGVLITTNLSVSRDRRHAMPEPLAALPRRAEDRTRAITLAGMALAPCLVAPMVAVYLTIRHAQGDVAGRIDWYEPLALVAATALAAAGGAALARWLPSLIAGPIAVVLLAMATLLNRNRPDLDAFGGFGSWFLPVVLRQRPDWPGRPSGLHVLYLAACLVLFLTVALLRHRVSVPRVGAVALALVVAVPTGAIASTRGADPKPGAVAGSDGSLGPDDLRCEVRDGMTFCAFPGYRPWIPLWADAVRPVVEALPPAARAKLPVVRQRTGTWAWSVETKDGSLDTGMVWGRGAAYRTMLAGGVAARVTGLSEEGCDGHGLARTVVALWLLGRTGAVPAPEGIRIDVVGDRVLGRPTPLGVRYGPTEAEYARRLLADPAARDRVWANWDTLLTASLSEALPLLGLTHDLLPIEGPSEVPCR